MQQTYGNRAVQRFIQRCACGEEEAPQHEAVRREGETPPPQEEELPSDTGAVAELQAAPVQRVVAKQEGEAAPPQEEELPSDTGAAAEIQAAPVQRAVAPPAPTRGPEATSAAAEIPATSGVATVLRPGQLPTTVANAEIPAGEFDMPKYQAVAPGGAPAVNNNAGANDCTPKTSAATLAWDVVSADASNWAVSVTSLTLAGQVNIKPWPSAPSTETVPNTANAVDGGNINNTAGSNNRWQAAIDDMADYNSAGGGAGPNWHSTAASSAHEWAHWNTDYLADSVASAAGGNWAQANTDLDALREPKASSADAATARTALTPKVNARFSTWRNATITRWNAIPDSPGVAGSTGYAAGMAVLNGLIGSVRTYATTKGWTGAPAPAGSGSGTPAPAPAPTGRGTPP